MKETASGDIVKIADFGLFKVLQDEKQQYMSTNAGTPIFRAPELSKQGKLQYTSAVDVFALGLVYLVMFKYDRKNHPTFEPYDQTTELKLPYGARLLHCQEEKKTFPTLFQPFLTSRHDNLLLAEIEILICKMVIYESEKRPKMKVIFNEVKVIAEKITGEQPVAHSDHQEEMKNEITRLKEEISRLKKENKVETSKLSEVNKTHITRLKEENQDLFSENEKLLLENQELKRSIAEYQNTSSSKSGKQNIC